MNLFYRLKSRRLRSLLPAYLNETLDEKERAEVFAWLQTSKQARQELETWRAVQRTIASQPTRLPNADARRHLMARLQTEQAPTAAAAIQTPQSKTLGAWQVNLLGGLVLSLLVLALMWLAVRPGVALKWTVEGSGISTYRVYRAPQDSQNFQLLTEIAARPQMEEYQYVDMLLLPGTAYIYRVEAVGQTGQLAISRSIASNPFEALPGQLATLFTGLVCGYCLMFGLRLVLNSVARHPRRMVYHS